MKQCQHCKKQKKDGNCIGCTANAMAVILQVYRMTTMVSTQDLPGRIIEFIEKEVPKIVE